MGRVDRTDEIDEAALHRLDEQELRIDERRLVHGRQRLTAVEEARQALMRARSVNLELGGLINENVGLRRTIRVLNASFSSIMEGTLSINTEPFAMMMHAFTRPPVMLWWPWTLYINVTYGDPAQQRVILFEFAKNYNLFPPLVRSLIETSERETEQARQAYREERLERECAYYATVIWSQQSTLLKERSERHLFTDTSTSVIRFTLPLVYLRFLWFRNWEPIRRLVEPHRGSTLFVPGMYTKIDWLVKEFTQTRPAFRERHFRYSDVIVELCGFLETYGDGALAILALIDAAQSGGWMRHWYVRPHSAKAYPGGANRTTKEFPRISGLTALETIRLVKTINETMRTLQRSDDFLKRYLKCFDSGFKRGLFGTDLDKNAFVALLKKAGLYSIDGPFYEIVSRQLICNGSVDRVREDVQCLQAFLKTNWGEFIHRWPAATRAWESYDELERAYLLARVCDIKTYNIDIANETFPQPQAPMAKEFVDGCIELLNEADENHIKQEQEQEWIRRWKHEEKDITAKLPMIVRPPPEKLQPRVLTSDELAQVRHACVKELSKDEWAVRAMENCKKFVEFCDLLSKPENHVKVPSAKYVERVVNSRAVIDMSHEMVQELIKLPRYQAYVKVIQERGGQQIVLTSRVRAPAPVERAGEPWHDLEGQAIKVGHLLYCKERDQIEEEIHQRRERVRKLASPRSSRGGGQRIRRHTRSEPPPPTSE